MKYGVNCYQEDLILPHWVQYFVFHECIVFVFCLMFSDLSNDEYTLGRKESCDIYISGKNMELNLVGIVSKIHFRISRDKDLVPFIEDLSRNGTYLNGGLLGKGKKSSLCTGDIIAIGNPRLQGKTIR